MLLFRLLPFLLSLGLCMATAPSSASIYLGIDVLEATGFRQIEGKRVGLLTHPAGVNREGVSSIDVLRRSPRVNLVALFGPEHGIYGNEKANVPITNRVDKRTGLPVFSLYGKYRKPTPDMLAQIDVLVIDLQDIGVRSYTYVSSMQYALEACIEQGKEIVVLDRPNPLGGNKVDGPMLDPEWRSYVGAFPVPYVHGLTIGELARMAQQENGILNLTPEQRRAAKLTVIPMRGWSRDMLWPDTGLDWVATSPAIPNLSAVLGYPMTGLGTQIGGFTHGYGTAYPFRLLQFPGKSPEEIATALNARRITGLEFRVLQFSERGQPRRGVYVVVTDWDRLRPTELSFHMMQLAATWSGSNPFAATTDNARDLYNKHVGSTAWWNAISTHGAQVDLPFFLERWERDARVFQQRSRQWWIY